MIGAMPPARPTPRSLAWPALIHPAKRFVRNRSRLSRAAACMMGAVLAVGLPLFGATVETTDSARVRFFEHQLALGKPPVVFDVREGGKAELTSLYGPQARAHLRCKDSGRGWTLSQVGESVTFPSACQNVEFDTSGRATKIQPVGANLRVTD